MGILDHPSSSGSSQPTRGMVSSSTSSTSSSGPLGIEWRKWFPPVTSRSFLSHYLPASGALSHTLYTVHLFSPNIISGLFPTGDLAVSNTILFNANVGLGFYVYFRRHLHRVNPWERVEFSVLASTLFNFGSLLAAVLIKAIIPTKTPTWLKTVSATVLSGYLLSRAAKYMGLLDHRTSGRGSVSPARSVLSPRQTAVSNGHAAPNGMMTPPPSREAPPTVMTSSSYGSTTPRPLHLDTMQTTVTQTPPTSLENPFLTPSGTTVSDWEPEGNGAPCQMTPGPNYRYLHSYALNNLGSSGHGTHKKEILRRTTLGAKPGSQAGAMAPLSFVTPDPGARAGAKPYTPPPSRLEVPKKARKARIPRKITHVENEKDDLDDVIDLVIGSAPLAIGGVALGCWWAGTVPGWSTMKFIFA